MPRKTVPLFYFNAAKETKSEEKSPSGDSPAGDVYRRKRERKRKRPYRESEEGEVFGEERGANLA